MPRVEILLILLADSLILQSSQEISHLLMDTGEIIPLKHPTKRAFKELDGTDPNACHRVLGHRLERDCRR